MYSLKIFMIEIMWRALVWDCDEKAIWRVSLRGILHHSKISVGLIRSSNDTDRRDLFAFKQARWCIRLRSLWLRQCEERLLGIVMKRRSGKFHCGLFYKKTTSVNHLLTLFHKGIFLALKLGPPVVWTPASALPHDALDIVLPSLSIWLRNS